MNREHAHNLRDYCRICHPKTAGAVKMIGIDCDGFDVRTAGEILRFDFEQTIHNALEARQMLVSMAQQARTG